MKRFILTGTPGAGKTVILRQLELDGFSVVEEAATDVIALQQAQGIAEPWTHSSFIDMIVHLQRQRQIRASSESGDAQFHDRSAICTAALARFLGYPPSDLLADELQRIKAERVYRREVFFIRNLGFVAPTEARKISFADALRFEQIHEELYRDLNFEIISVEPGSLQERVTAIKKTLQVIEKHPE